MLDLFRFPQAVPGAWGDRGGEWLFLLSGEASLLCGSIVFADGGTGARSCARTTGQTPWDLDLRAVAPKFGESIAEHLAQRLLAMDRYRLALRPKWLLSHVLILLLIVVMINLGFWQLRRLDEKKTYNRSRPGERVVGGPLPGRVVVAANRSHEPWR